MPHEDANLVHHQYKFIQRTPAKGAIKQSFAFKQHVNQEAVNSNEIQLYHNTSDTIIDK